MVLNRIKRWSQALYRRFKGVRDGSIFPNVRHPFTWLWLLVDYAFFSPEVLTEPHVAIVMRDTQVNNMDLQSRLQSGDERSNVADVTEIPNGGSNADPETRVSENIERLRSIINTLPDNSKYVSRIAEKSIVHAVLAPSGNDSDYYNFEKDVKKFQGMEHVYDGIQVRFHLAGQARADRGLYHIWRHELCMTLACDQNSDKVKSISTSNAQAEMEMETLIREAHNIDL